jgi:16S rRNA (guanine527-N7)-methyltransferase
MVKTVPQIDSREAFAARFAFSRETVDRLATYEAMLKRWQTTINLVAPSTLNHVWHRHFADSAQVYVLAGSLGTSGLDARMRPTPSSSSQGGRERATWLDLGSGAGFPGLVIAILAAEHGCTQHTLVESDTRKAAFLREVARETGVVVDIVAARIEIPANSAKVGEINFVTARALAPLPRLVELAYPYFGPQTVGLFLKGRDIAAEIEAASRDWSFAYELKPSVTGEEGRVLVLQLLERKNASPK